MSETEGGNLIVVLGNQLSQDVPAIRGGHRGRDVVLLAETRSIAQRLPYLKKKRAFVFSAMRHFARELEHDGWRVRYVRYDNSENRGSLSGEIERAPEALDPVRIVVTEPGS